MALADPLLSEWFQSTGFDDYAEILTNELGVEEYDDFRLLRDERDINELLDDMANLKAMDEAFKQRFKTEMKRIIQTPSPPRRSRGSITSNSASKKTSISAAIVPSNEPQTAQISVSTSATAGSPKSKDSSLKRPAHKRMASTPMKPQQKLKPSKPAKARSVDTSDKRHNSLTLSSKKSKKKKRASSPAQSESSESTDTFVVDSPTARRLLKKSPSAKDVARSKRSHLKSSKSMSVLPDLKKQRKSAKMEKNKTRSGGTVHSNRRVRLDDGRIGVVKYKGRTAFGKSGEDWIGIVVEYGKGQHNGSVNGKSYFRCREGKGIMVRPERILEDLGNPMTKELDDAMKRGSPEIQALLKEIARERKEGRIRKKRAAEAAAAKMDGNYGGDVGWTPSQYQQDDSEMFGQKLMHSKTLLDKNKDEKAVRKKKVDEL